MWTRPSDRTTGGPFQTIQSPPAGAGSSWSLHRGHHVGSEHTMALTSCGNVWVWGNNMDGQLGLGHTNTMREPVLVTSLQGKNIRQISTGRSHSAAWTASPVPPRAPGTPLPLQLGKFMLAFAKRSCAFAFICLKQILVLFFFSFQQQFVHMGTQFALICMQFACICSIC